MDASLNERITVVAGVDSYGVTLVLGDSVVTVRAPRGAGDAGLSEEQLRIAAMRTARRALQVALEEIGLALA